ncbi:putative dithiol-disulfide oxidoreductase (DUF899 family) [Pararhizobium capsulatum DSM 1112]|uniref:Dithiol-disulfide oxidoreductase (DUF899 family) n=1 Tax=Pararhizobium capsulatum DSM 1112 TaxID=1121113 RepID=A0ABU0BUD6_9HYPH|nr:thioredoxin family protein [Pararhizobium capsulatum]MDQ0321853.1 putative dithiol-disulfide oxidoreductase (DUF899 family) [Pararhizobium capsulatum DSM 1112]
MLSNPVVSREEWLEARRSLLAKEKEETRLRDKIRAERQAMPWVKVDKTYTFDTPTGKKTLTDLFDGRSQLMIYHFMFGPDWEAGCPGCSFLADHLGGTLPHLNNHDVTMAVVSRASLEKIEAYKNRMGWHFPWVSSYGNDFNFDYHVSFTKEELDCGKVFYNFNEVPSEEAHDELPGMSAFYKDENGTIYHTYSDYSRGGEEILATLMILDRAPKGRNETSTLSFVKRHDEYEVPAQAQSCCA